MLNDRKNIINRCVYHTTFTYKLQINHHEPFFLLSIEIKKKNTHNRACAIYGALQNGVVVFGEKYVSNKDNPCL